MRERGLWVWHVAAGLIILPLLALHMGVMHLDATLNLFNPAGGHPIEWANVVARAKSLFFTLTYPLLLSAALFHGLYGVRTIVSELGPPGWLKRTVGAALLVVGLALLAVGVWSALASHAVASGAVLGG